MQSSEVSSVAQLGVGAEVPPEINSEAASTDQKQT